MVRRGFAVEVQISSGFWRWTSGPATVYVEGEAYSPRIVQVTGAPSYGAPASTSMALTLEDVGRVVATELRSHGLHRRRVRVWELLAKDWATAAAPLPWFRGSVESVTLREGWAVLNVGPELTPWAILAPPSFAQLCRYVSVTQCPLVATCSRTAAACAANGHADIFGGFDHLPAAGTVLTFGDSSVTIKGGDRGY